MSPSTQFDIDKGESLFLREIACRVSSRRWPPDGDGKLKPSQAVSGEIDLPGLDAGADQDGDHLIQARGKVDCETAMRAASFRSQATLGLLSGGVVPADVILDKARKPNLFADSKGSIGGQHRSSACAPLAVQAALFGATYTETALASNVFTRNQPPLGLLARLHRGHAMGSIKVKGQCL